MKSFIINRNSWHYKMNTIFFNEYQYSMQRNWEPRHNDFCSYWRATMLRFVFTLMLTTIICAFFYVLGDVTYHYPLEVVKTVGIILAIAATIIGCTAAALYLSKRKYKYTDKPDSLFVQRYKAYKTKICPMVEYKE